MQNLKVFILATFACAACVAPKKYQALTARYDTLARRATADSTQLATGNARLAVSLDSLATRYNSLTDQHLRLKNDSATLAQTYRRNKALLDDLFEKYDRLAQTRQAPADSTPTGVATSAQRERDLLAFEQKLLAQQARNDRQEAALQERAMKVLSFEENLRRIEKNTADLRFLLEKSIGGKDTGVAVQSEAAEVRVSARETFWFAGKNLTTKAMEMLDKMAAASRTQPDVDFVIRSASPSDIARSEKICDYLRNKNVTKSRIFFGFVDTLTTSPAAEQSVVNKTSRMEITAKFSTNVFISSPKREKYIPPAREK